MIPQVEHWVLMGGYWPYVWSAYGITLALLIANGVRLYKNSPQKK